MIRVQIEPQTYSISDKSVVQYSDVPVPLAILTSPLAFIGLHRRLCIVSFSYLLRPAPFRLVARDRQNFALYVQLNGTRTILSFLMQKIRRYDPLGPFDG